MTRLALPPRTCHWSRTAFRAFAPGCLCVWFCLFFSQLLLAQEDPRRFLQVTNWVARFTWDATDSGSAVAGCQYQWQVHATAAVQLNLMQIGSSFWSGWTNLDANNAQESGHGAETCPMGNPGYNDITGFDNSLAISPASMELLVDVQAGTYEIGFGGGFNNVVQLTSVSDNFLGGHVSLGDTMVLSNVPFALPAAGLVISGQTTLPLAQLPLGYSEWTPGNQFGQQAAGTLTLSWVLIGEPLEVVVDIGGYDQWLPEGNLKDGTQLGKTLTATATLQGPNGQPTSARADTFAFALNNVSRVPGICMNRPNLDLADTNLDLRFLQTNNPYPMLVDSEVFAHSAEGFQGSGQYQSNQVTISCFDYGAYGSLAVTGYVHGFPITGYLRPDKAHQHPDILLPKRDPGSHIADAWKQDNQAVGLADSDDSESDPAGDGHSGDGLSLYEEYRGFSENSKHIRTNPHKKDLFICDGIGNWRSKNGIQLFQTRSGLAVHHEMRREELSSTTGQTDGWINFNKDANHVVDQHGLLLITWDGPVNQTGSRAHPGGVNSTPGSVSEIRIGASILDPGGGIANIAGINQVTRNGVHILTDAVQASVAHELAHGCSVYHHGDLDRSKVQWLVKLDTTVFPATYQAFEMGVPITVLAEGPPEAVLAVAPFLGQRTVWLGMPQGQHSGDEECFMRYDCADAYPQTGSEVRRFWIAGTELSADSPELAGIFLCASPAGTGVNLAGRQPQPRYGDADATHRRGNCAGQLCVNDLYINSPVHSR